MIRESESIGETSFESCSSTAYGAASQASSRGASKRWSTNPLERSSREGGTGNKPHKANDRRWEAIKLLRERDGKVGLSHFRLLQRLGSGDIGSVYLAELRGAGCCFAMKVMDKTALASRNKLPRADTEREILASLDHPFLPTLYAHFETAQFSCLVMEFCPGGDLHSLRQRQSGKCFDEDAARFYAAEVLLALEYLHMMGVVYRDLKPENVLVREDGHIMLSDFDLSLICDVSPTVVHSTSSVHRSSRQISFKSDNSCILPSCVAPCTTIRPVVACVPIALQKNSALKNKKYGHRDGDSASKVAPLPELIAEPTDARSMSFVGTHEYLAPEIISGGGHGSAVDWWTFGIFLYELLYGRTPFRGENNESTLMNVLRKNLEFPESIEVRECAKNLIKGLLIKDPERRLASARGAAEVKQHPFFDGINWALIRCAYPPDVPGPYRLVPESGFLANSNSAGSSKETSAVSTPTSTAKLKKNRSVGGSFSSDSLPNFEYF